MLWFPMRLKVQEHSGEVLIKFNMMHLEDGDDHRPIAIMIQVPAKPRTAVKKRKATRYDRSKIGDLDCDAKFQAVVHAYTPCVPYSVDSHSHVHIVTSFIIAALEWAYPKKAGPTQKSPIIGEEVFALVVIQGTYKAALRKANRTIMRQV